MDFKLIASVAGASLILIGFILNELKFLPSDSVPYYLLNIFGASLLALYGLMISSVALITLNGVWASFAFYRLAAAVFRR